MKVAAYMRFGRQIKRLSLELDMIFYLVGRRGGN